MRDDVSLPCTVGSLDAEGLAALNRSPLSFLATCGVAHGGSFADAFSEAQLLLDRHGTSRRIQPDDADHLCAAMRLWASGARHEIG